MVLVMFVLLFRWTNGKHDIREKQFLVQEEKCYLIKFPDGH